MTRQDLKEQVVLPTLKQVEELFQTKGDEYAIKSAFHNFVEAVKLSRTAKTPIQVLEGYMLKHEMSLEDILYDADRVYTINPDSYSIEELQKLHENKPSKEKLDEKLNDILVYLILLKGMLYEIYAYGK